jgi:hypothetical protein
MAIAVEAQMSLADQTAVSACSGQLQTSAGANMMKEVWKKIGLAFGDSVTVAPKAKRQIEVRHIRRDINSDRLSG